MSWGIVITVWIGLIISTILYMVGSEIRTIYGRWWWSKRYEKQLKREEYLEKEGKSHSEIIAILGKENREEIKRVGEKKLWKKYWRAF